MQIPLFCFQSNFESQVRSKHSEAKELSKTNPDSALLLLNLSRKSLSKESHGELLTDNYWLMGRTFYLKRSYDSSFHYLRLGIELGEKTDEKVSLAKIFNLKGVIFDARSQLDSALASYKRSLRYKILLSDSAGMARTLQNLGIVYRKLGNADSTQHYYDASIQIKEKIGETATLSTTIYNRGVSYQKTGEYLMAIEQYRKAANLNIKYNDGSSLYRIYGAIGSAYRYLGYYRLALEFFYKSLNNIDDADLNMEQAATLFNMASFFTLQGKYEDALTNYRACLKLYRGEAKSVDRADVYLNLADLFLFQGKKDSALYYLNEGERIYARKGLKDKLSSIFHGYGRVNSQMGRFEEARCHFERSIEIKKTLDMAGIGRVYNSYAVSLYEAKDFYSSRKYYNLSLGLARKYRQPDLMRASLLGLSEVTRALGNNKLAYDYRLQYEVVKDSLDNVEKDRQIAELREIHEAEQKDKQITQLELENEVINAQSEANAAQAARQRADKLTFIVVATALLIVAIILYFYLRQRLMLARLREKEEKEAHIKSVNKLLVQQQTKTLEAMVEGQEQERLRIARELHDHFGSLMAAVKVNLTTVVANGKLDKAKDKQMENLSVLVDQACEDIRSLSHSMHVGISESFGLIPALKDLAHSVSSSGRVEVAFHSASCAGKLDSTIEVMAYRLIQELVSNALKHAQATKLTIQVTCLGDIVNIIVEDNGKGFDARHYMELSEGMGLKSMQERIMSLHGEFEVDSQSGKGTTVIIDLPVSIEQQMNTA